MARNAGAQERSWPQDDDFAGMLGALAGYGPEVAAVPQVVPVAPVLVPTRRPVVAAEALPAGEATVMAPWIRAAFGRSIMEESVARGANPGLVAEVLHEIGLPAGKVAGYAQG